MLRLSTDLLQPGMILAKPVIDDRGNVLLRQGVCLTEEYVAKLRRRGFSGVYIDDGDTDDVVIEDMISDEVRRSAQTTLARVFDFSKQVSSEFALASSDTIVACMQNNAVKEALRSEEAFKQLEELLKSAATTT
jgi:endo-alpha-1,4-polygalactosaminidase (GH114 family)